MKTLSHYSKPLIAVAALFLGSTTMAEPDFKRIHKDVTVMSNIIKGAFEAEDDCRGCNPRIAANYLADQGAVFTIRVSNWRFNFGESEGNSYSFVIPSPPAPEEIRHIEITEVVSDVLENLGEVMDDVGSQIEFRMEHLGHDETLLRIDSETRRALRDLNRERRELEYQRREYEIELIHAEESSRRNIEKQIAKLEKDVSSVEQKQAELNQAFEVERKEREQAREEKRQKERQQAEQQLAAVENVVIRSLCDYGATLKNIPREEHVSLLFERSNDDQTKVIIMDMGDVQGCREASVLRSDATIYSF